jgi:hypothetical protein
LCEYFDALFLSSILVKCVKELQFPRTAEYSVHCTDIGINGCVAQFYRDKRKKKKIEDIKLGEC